MNSVIYNRKRVLLTGNCEYELLGLTSLLTSMDYEVQRPKMPDAGTYDLVLVALSAELLAGWGRHIQGIRMLHAGNPVPMVVLVPSKLQGMHLLKGTAQVINGRYSLTQLRTMLRLAFEKQSRTEQSGKLTRHQKKALMSLRLIISSNASRKASSHKDYYLRACLVEHVGMDSLHVLCVSGLLSEMAGWPE
ncbi:hypothetical protein HQS73_003649 [Salmonella enterica]|nr:hypothetical protein [Salmonella enterica]ECJ2545666.1 hypothetical protein [Salmonella enterica subsp. arizonae]EAX5088140.1 hypothetical protein [Salmonella enterica]EAZ5906696.1 hypothetical protein [Salmonella enterica]EBT7486472.1 hypothetical protein [Salmonella enterica]